MAMTSSARTAVDQPDDRSKGNTCQMRIAVTSPIPVVTRSPGTVGAIVLGLSACGYPLTQLAVRRWGVRGVAVAEPVAGLAIRDASMVASGVPDRLHPVPAALPRLEPAACVVAVLAGSPPLVNARRARREHLKN